MRRPLNFHQHRLAQMSGICANRKIQEIQLQIQIADIQKCKISANKCNFESILIRHSHNTEFYSKFALSNANLTNDFNSGLPATKTKKSHFYEKPRSGRFWLFLAKILPFGLPEPLIRVWRTRISEQNFYFIVDSLSCEALSYGINFRSPR